MKISFFCDEIPLKLKFLQKNPLLITEGEIEDLKPLEIHSIKEV